MKTMYFQLKKSGSYIATPYKREEWTLIKECNDPAELLSAIRSIHPFSKIIKKEYARSQVTTSACLYFIKDAIKAFGLPATKENVRKFSNQ